MKYVIVFFLMMLSVISADDIVWQSDLESARKLAKKEHRLMMIMVEGEHCRWCKKMRYRTLSEDAVIEKLKPFVCVRVDKENKESMDTLPRINGVPTIFFMSAENELIETAVGYFNTSDFLSFFESINRKVSPKK